MDFATSAALRERYHALVPGGSHTYAKGDDQYPEHAPGFIARGSGCHVWDADGNEFIEYGMGLRSVTLGHAHPQVNDAASRQMALGSNFTRPATVELEAAQTLLDLLPRADMVKFAKNGSDVTTAAVKLARAATGRDLVAICADQPFFSTDDWFIGTTPMDRGIPAVVRDLTVRFRYNDLDSLERVFAEHPGRVAAVITEAATVVEPEPGFLEGLRRLCSDHGAVFVLDEMITGFRWDLGGAQAYYDLDPDLSTFGKGIANGFAVAALAGKRELMQLGGLRHDGGRVFLLSTTHGAETHALAAAIETLRIYRESDVVEVLKARGTRLREGVDEHIAALGLDGRFAVLGMPSNMVYATWDAEGERSQAFRTLFLQEMIQRGILAPSLVVSAAHTETDIDETIDAVGEALVSYRKALENGIEGYLVGRPVQPVWRRHN